MRTGYFATFALVLPAFGAAACAEGPAQGPMVVAPAPGPAGTATASTAAAPPPAATSVPTPAAPAGAKLCGCSLCEPLPSDDPCTSDADCAPSVPCHAPLCVAKDKATLRKPGDMCSMKMVCASADANGCGCVNGHCALSPRPKS